MGIYNDDNVAEVAGGFSCPAPGELANAGSFSRHAHPDDCRKYYICLEGVAREYGCPIGTVFKIGESDGSGNCEDPEDVPGWWVFIPPCHPLFTLQNTVKQLQLYYTNQ